MLPKLTAKHIEVLVANFFDFRRHIVIPNVTYFFNHECDLLIIRPKTRYAIEVEIKISKSDLKADLKKYHKHYSSKIKELWFAVPQCLVECAVEILPENVGIISINIEPENKKAYFPTPERYYCSWYRHAKPNNSAIPLSQEDINKALHLGIMRIWKLKSKQCEK